MSASKITILYLSLENIVLSQLPFLQHGLNLYQDPHHLRQEYLDSVPFVRGAEKERIQAPASRRAIKFS